MSSAAVPALIAVFAVFLLECSETDLTHQIIVLRLVYDYLFYDMVSAQTGRLLALLVHPYKFAGCLDTEFERISMLALVGIPELLLEYLCFAQVGYTLLCLYLIRILGKFL